MPSLTDSIGRVLGDRYRLVTALGTGASAHVYLADDVSLHRQVAIKVLHPALAGDRAFLKRFRAEARAVAALNHPNILRVYDWGEEDGQPYLVLEYLAGGSLREVYDTGALLTPEQAAQIGIEAAAGLDYAHRRGLVHRDIKPANLLFDGDRRLRIADFGLARALAEAAWTEPDGAILGTARYAAPEAVEGWVLDGKADVYALALVLYEGVTGESPFIGDTTVATLMARVGALLPDHEALGPLADVLAWAAAPDPAERWSAARFGRELGEISAALPPPAPLPLVAAVPATRTENQPEGAAPRPVVDRTEQDRTELGTPGQAAAAVAADPSRTKRRWLIAIAVLVPLLMAGGGVAWGLETGLFTPSHPVPALVGKTVASASAAAAPDHLTVRAVGHLPSITAPAGIILSQQPPASRGGRTITAKQGSVITVVVSTGPPPVAVPNLTSFTGCNDAVQALRVVHLVGVCPASAAQYSSTVDTGGILATVPTGIAPYGSTITIVTSKGHAPVSIPPAAASAASYADAAAALTAAGFTPVQGQAYSATVPTGQVIGTAPPPSAGPLPYGSQVTVVVSLGPKPVTLPDLRSDSVAQAESALGALGLKYGGPYGPPGSTKVLSTDPVAGTSVLPGTTVNLYTL